MHTYTYCNTCYLFCYCIFLATLRVITPFFLFIIVSACTAYLRNGVTFHLIKTKTKANAFLYGEITNQTCDPPKKKE